MEELFKISKLGMRYPIKDGLLNTVKGYVHALNNVDLTIYKNEILGLVGESGSGKSTLAGCILRLITPSCGEIFFNNENILLKSKKELKSFRRQVQPIFQNPYMSLNPRMKIFEILKEPFIINGITSKKVIEEKILNIINLTGMKPEVLGCYPHEFSGGQRQRIAIARAIVLNPQFIAADEPVSALDVSIQAQIVNLLLDLKERLNLTMLFISHDLSIVKYISDRTAVMYLGEIVEIASKDELFSNYKHPYTKALLNAVPQICGGKTAGKLFINGDLPLQNSISGGCKFHTRCPYVSDICRHNTPELKCMAENHFVRCFLAENN